jgi:hypothetical protein
MAHKVPAPVAWVGGAMVLLTAVGAAPTAYGFGTTMVHATSVTAGMAADLAKGIGPGIKEGQSYGGGSAPTATAQ